MSTHPRPRRSVLYVPGENERVLSKASSLPADSLIFDLEDAVGADNKVRARARVCELTASGVYAPREIAVRVNGIGTRWHSDDIVAVARAGVDAVLVPKVDSPDQIQALTAALDAAGAPENLSLWVMIETPRAFLDVRDIADAGGRLGAFVIGTNDLVNDLHARYVPGRAPIVTALSMAVLAARAASVTVLDGVFNDLDDDQGYLDELQQGREMGFDGKTVVHPKQIGPANDIFGPSRDEVTHARAVIDAFEESKHNGRSVTVVAGRMVEELHVRDAQRILHLHSAIAATANA